MNDKPEASLDHAQGAPAYVSRFNIGDTVRITPPPGDWPEAPKLRKVLAITFTESKVTYDLQAEGGDTIHGVDSCDVEPAEPA